jgi:hypothetical protein
LTDNRKGMLPKQRTDENYQERHKSFLARATEGPIDLLFLGDSIIRRWEEVPELWARYYSKRRAANFGIGGDTIQSLWVPTTCPSTRRMR